VRRTAALLITAYLASAGEIPAERVLERNGIQPTLQSISTYLRGHYADGAKRRDIESFIARLADDGPLVRRAAARELGRLAPAPLPALRGASGSLDPELRRWAALLARTMQGRIRPEVLRACFATIRDRGFGGLATELVAVLPLCDSDDFVHAAACEALAVTTGPGDAEALGAALRRGRPRSRYAVALAYGLLSSDRAADLLRERDDHLRLGAARALAELGQQACLGPLVELLGSRDPWVRLVAVQTLRAVGRQRFGFSPFDGPEHRRAAAAAWRRAALDIDRWQTPLPRRPVDLGRTLVSHWTDKRIIELDHQGNVIWEIKTKESPWANLGLPNGHRVVSFYKAKRVTEYDLNGKQVWSVKVAGHPTSIAALGNGGLLVSCGQLVEIDRDGAIVRRNDSLKSVVDARPMRNGHLLVTLSGKARVFEQTRDGRIVHTWRIPSQPTEAQPLDNGHILVSEPSKGRVVEYTRDGKIAWSRAGYTGPISAQRLANGLTMIATRTGIRLIDREGTTRWSKRFMGYLCASRH